MSITYAGCPITWTSKLQTLTAFSTTEAEYIGPAMAMHDQLPLLHLLQEVLHPKIDTYFKSATIHCKALEDNSGALEIAKIPKIWALHKTSHQHISPFL